MSPSSPKRVEPARETAEPHNLRARRAAAAMVFALGAALLALAAICSPPIREACILFGLVLALPALTCLAVDLLLRFAARAVDQSPPKND